MKLWPDKSSVYVVAYIQCARGVCFAPPMCFIGKRSVIINDPFSDSFEAVHRQYIHFILPAAVEHVLCLLYMPRLVKPVALKQS